MALAGVLLPGAAIAEACPPVAEETVRAVEAIDGDTVRLQDGRTLRLVAILAPKPGPGEVPEAGSLAAAARTVLAGAVEGRDLGLAFTGGREDRHGRLLAHALVDGDPRRWLQREMVDKGLARVYSLNDNYHCVRPLFDREAAARAAGSGLWSTELGVIRDSGRPKRLAEDAGRFAIVEGRVRTVGDRPKQTYLNFGTNWSHDFTVFVDRGDRARFDAAGIDLEGLEGRRVRVRGWIIEDRGPAIHMTHPEQLEIVDAR